ncbi:MAG: hypothetical protein H6648_03745 [Caldilineae bacterium]|nr:hypothetical protein [Caldilineae bacterium]
MKVRWGRVLLALTLLGVGCIGAFWIYAVLSESVGTQVGQGLDRVAEQAQQAADKVIDQVGDAGSSARDAGSSKPDAGGEGDAAAASSSDDVGPSTAGEGLPPFRVLTLAYSPYMATLAHMDAGGYLEDLGYDLQLIDVYDPEVDLDEAGQCAAVASGSAEALATTLDATRKCGEAVAIGIPIGQSAGNDAIVVKPGVETWAQIFEHAIAFTDGSVSEYMACFASHSSSRPIDLAQRYGDASEAVDAWINSGAEQNILSVVAWEPEVTRALAAVPGSRVILSSADVRILWDVIEFSRKGVERDADAYQAFTTAYYRALRDLIRDPGAAFDRIDAWAAGDPGRAALLTVETRDDFLAELDNEAFATLRDAQILMQDEVTIVNRLDEAAFYWSYCGVDLPEVADERLLVLPEFVMAAAEDEALRGRPNDRPSSKVFQVTDFTDAGAVTDDQIEAGRVIFETGVDIEFQPNRTDFRDSVGAYATLENAVRFLRTCQDCVLEVQGGAAYPGEALCSSCTAAESDALAVRRGDRVYQELIQRFDVPQSQLRFVETPHAPQFPGSNVESELRQDRRTFLTGYQLAGR